VPWRVLVVAALLSLLLGAALWKGSGAQRSSTAARVRPGVSPHVLPVLPSAALGPVSAALGRSDRAYRLSVSGAGIDAKNPAQGMGLRFGRSGVQLSSGGVRLGLSLRSAGYGTSLRAVGDATPRVSANRVLYARAGLEEWYVNGPLGIEQGFTLPRAPSGPSSGTLTLAMTLSGDIHPSVDPTGQSITLAGAAGPSLRYGALVATDARGQRLRSWLALNGRTVLVRVDTRGARYPLRIDPLIQQVPRLTAGSGSEGAEFGYSVALSADGNTALIGDRQSHEAAWVFKRSGSTWAQQGSPLAINEENAGGQCDEEPGECGGRSVALSADGNTALIGAPNENGGRGAVWVFARSGTTWEQQGAKLTGGANEIGEGRFGRSLSLSADGSTALVGAAADYAHRGAAWIFTRSGSNWALPGTKLTGGEEEDGESHFGRSVALSADVTTALVGGPGDTGDRGAAWVFARAGTAWPQQGAKLTGGEEESGEGRFGYSVALSAFGNTALVGARGDSGSVGAAWVFARSSTTWKQQGAKLKGGGEGGEGQFGYGVALSADGEVALIGARKDSGAVGAVWVFTRPGTTWEQQGAKLAGVEEGEKDEFGTGVALSAGGGTVLIGGPLTEAKSGAAWAFLNESVPPPTVSSVSPAFGSSAGGTLVRIEGSGFVAGATVKIGGAAGSVDVLSETELTAVTSAHAVGPQEVVVSDANGLSTGGPTYTYVPPPTVSGVSPASGSTAGGTAVTIKGSGFLAGATVEIGGVAGSVDVLSETELTAVSSAHAAGPQEVVVSDANVVSTGGPTYTFVEPPTVSSVSPAFGSSAGGTLVRIKGSGFVAGATVKMGGVAGSVDVLSETELTAVSSAHAAGPQEVVVSDADVLSTGGPTYTYVPPPTVWSVSPAFGSSAGGTAVTIKGSGFLAGATVEIGGVAGSVDVLSETELTAVSSAHAVGPQEVVVSDAKGVSTGGPTYTYVKPPTSLLLLVSPIVGSGGGSGVLTNSAVVPPPPKLGVTGNLTPVSGQVLVRLPGSKIFVALTGITQVPFGTIVNATNGKVTVTTVGPHGALQTMTFYAGEFALIRGPRRGIVVVVLVGGSFSVCPTARERSHLARTSSNHASGKHAVRKLWANGHGSYTTKGSYASGAVLGTRWLTEDLCEGTLIRVLTDRVAVRNLVNHHLVIVTAGHSYLAKAP